MVTKVRTVIVLGIVATAGVAGAAWFRFSAGTPPVAVEKTAVDPSAPRPRLEAPETEHQFGIFDVGDKGTHSFTIRNRGDAPLELELLRTSCKCTLADIKNLSVAPGTETKVDLSWDAEEPTETFGHGARIRTNDPDRPEISLLVSGRVRAKMAIWPELVYFSDIPRGAERRHTVTLFSQAFDHVEVTKIESTHPFVAAELTDDPPASLGERVALFARTLRLTCRADRKVAPFHGTVRIHYTASGPFAPQVESPFEFHFTGETVGDVSLHGRQVVGKVLNFGPVAQSRGAKERVYLHVRDGDLNLHPRIDSIKPEFLKVRFDAPQRLSATMTRYPLEIEVPAGSPAATYSGTELGEVRLKTDHADYPSVRFQVALVVAP
jgi:hypothetical protein